jgi:hypothetical protein
VTLLPRLARGLRLTEICDGEEGGTVAGAGSAGGLGSLTSVTYFGAPSSMPS